MKKSDPLISASNALAYQSRKLREAAESSKPSPALDAVDRLAKSAGQFIAGVENEVQQRKHEAQARARAVTEPLVETARARMADAESLKKEHGELIDRLTKLPYDALRKSTKIRVTPGSTEDTMSRINFLERAVSEVAATLQSSDHELAAVTDRVEALVSLDSNEAQAALALIRHLLAQFDRPAFIRSRMAGITRLLAELAEDFASDEGYVQPSAEPVPFEAKTIALNLWPSTTSAPVNDTPQAQTEAN